MENVKEFGAHLYFSPVCPLSGQGEPPGEVHHVELRIRRSGKISLQLSDHTKVPYS